MSEVSPQRRHRASSVFAPSHLGTNFFALAKTYIHEPGSLYPPSAVDNIHVEALVWKENRNNHWDERVLRLSGSSMTLELWDVDMAKCTKRVPQVHYNVTDVGDHVSFQVELDPRLYKIQPIPVDQQCKQQLQQDVENDFKPSPLAPKSSGSSSLFHSKSFPKRSSSMGVLESSSAHQGYRPKQNIIVEQEGSDSTLQSSITPSSATQLNHRHCKTPISRAAAYKSTKLPLHTVTNSTSHRKVMFPSTKKKPQEQQKTDWESILRNVTLARAKQERTSTSMNAYKFRFLTQLQCTNDLLTTAVVAEYKNDPTQSHLELVVSTLRRDSYVGLYTNHRQQHRAYDVESSSSSEEELHEHKTNTMEEQIESTLHDLVERRPELRRKDVTEPSIFAPQMGEMQSQGYTIKIQTCNRTWHFLIPDLQQTLQLSQALQRIQAYIEYTQGIYDVQTKAQRAYIRMFVLNLPLDTELRRCLQQKEQILRHKDQLVREHKQTMEKARKVEKETIKYFDLSPIIRKTQMMVFNYKKRLILLRASIDLYTAALLKWPEALEQPDGTAMHQYIRHKYGQSGGQVTTPPEYPQRELYGQPPLSSLQDYRHSTKGHSSDATYCHECKRVGSEYFQCDDCGLQFCEECMALTDLGTCTEYLPVGRRESNRGLQRNLCHVCQEVPTGIIRTSAAASGCVCLEVLEIRGLERYGPTRVVAALEAETCSLFKIDLSKHSQMTTRVIQPWHGVHSILTLKQFKDGHLMDEPLGFAWVHCDSLPTEERLDLWLPVYMPIASTETPDTRTDQESQQSGKRCQTGLIHVRLVLTVSKLQPLLPQPDIAGKIDHGYDKAELSASVTRLQSVFDQLFSKHLWEQYESLRAFESPLASLQFFISLGLLVLFTQPHQIGSMVQGVLGLHILSFQIIRRVSSSTHVNNHLHLFIPKRVHIYKPLGLDEDPKLDSTFSHNIQGDIIETKLPRKNVELGRIGILESRDVDSIIDTYGGQDDVEMYHPASATQEAVDQEEVEDSGILAFVYKFKRTVFNVQTTVDTACDTAERVLNIFRWRNLRLTTSF